tara:strand:- start:114 stop:761 length:648 start_codon:yes stop_codon:yes gene_type:complete
MDFVKICGFNRKDPKEQFKEWRRGMRREIRLQDRQIRQIEFAQRKVKRSIKESAKRGDMDSARLLAKEVVRANKAVERIHTTKAQMNSVILQLQQQISQRQMLAHMGKSAEMSAAMNQLVRVFEVQETMLAMSNEMIKAGIIEEMTDDAMEVLDDYGDEDAADEELDKVLVELNVVATGGMASVPTQQVAGAAAAREDSWSQRAQSQLKALTGAG